jgi:hypothetical protein
MRKQAVHPDIDRLCQQMCHTGRRWALILPPATRASKVIISHWMNMQTSQPVGGTGLLVAPAATHMDWYRAGWRGPLLGTGQFQKYELPQGPNPARVVTAAFDELQMYSPAFLDKMTEFLKVDGDYCVIRVPDNADQHPGLDVLLGTCGFVPLKVNLV